MLNRLAIPNVNAPEYMCTPMALGRCIGSPPVHREDINKVIDRVLAVPDHLDVCQLLLLNPTPLVVDRPPVAGDVLLLDRLAPVPVIDLLDTKIGWGVEVDEHQGVLVSELEERLERAGHDQALKQHVS